MNERPVAESAGRLLVRAGHDVRGSAAVVAGALDEMENVLSKDAAGAWSALMAIARRGVRRLLRLADRYSSAAEIALNRGPASFQPIDVEPLVRAAASEASGIYGRRGLEVALHLTPVQAVMHHRWMTAALTEAMMLALRASRAGVRVELDHQDNLVRITIVSDAGATSLAKAWDAALAASADLSGEAVLPIRIIDGVLRAHRGEARIERAGEEARIFLLWPMRGAPPEGVQ
jgi:signal transduction histidine kinase